MATRGMFRLGLLGGVGLAAVGCGGGGDTTDGTAQPVRTVRRERSNDVGRLPDPLAAAVDVAPEDQMTPPQLVDALGTPDYPRMVRARDRLVRMGPTAIAPLVGGFAHK